MVMTPTSSEGSELARVVGFRNHLVAYLNDIAALRASALHGYEDENRLRSLAVQQSSLAQSYGRLRPVINRYGTMTMGSPAAGITSHDVIRDAICDMSDHEAGRFSVHHLDDVIGRLQEARERPSVSRPDLYRLTSPVFWIVRVATLVRWAWATTRRRVITFVGAVVLGVVTALATGWAQALLARL